MTRYTAFVRAINVAGHARVRMSDLRQAFTKAGCDRVRTYFQSGKVLFDAAGSSPERLFVAIRKQLRGLISEEPIVVFREFGAICRLVEANPFGKFVSEPDTKLYVAFLAQRPVRQPPLPLNDPNERLEVIGMQGLEVFVVSRRKKNGFYGFPNNVVEAQLGVPATSRNWTTLSKLARLDDLAGIP